MDFLCSVIFILVTLCLCACMYACGLVANEKYILYRYIADTLLSQNVSTCNSRQQNEVQIIEEDCLLECDTGYGRSLPTFWGNILPPFSGLKSEASKQLPGCLLGFVLFLPRRWRKCIFKKFSKLLLDTWCHILESNNFCSHCCEKLTSNINGIVWKFCFETGLLRKSY